MRIRTSYQLGGLFVVLLCLQYVHAEEVVRQSRGLPEGMKNTQDARDVAESPRDSLARITVPEGFRVSLFAGEPDIAQPIAFTFDDRGRLWVVECYSHPEWQAEARDRVVILEDTDNDGQFDQRTVFWDKGNYLSGIAVGHGGVFLCNTPNLIFIPDRDGDDRPDGEPQVLLDGWNRKNPHNVFNNLIFGPDGWLYGCVGQRAESRIGRPGQPDEQRKTISRGIWRYHPYDHEFEVVAIGAVNPWGLDFDQHGQAFFSNCVLPHLWHLVPGAWYQRRKGERDNPY
ncbi:MAG: PVC-type heme-binding CxxCH protein, partial [Planctomycetota bacterium]